MKYLIRSPFWTRNDKAETWWKPDSNGYTTLMVDAGIYTKSDKETMGIIHCPDRCEFVQITKKVWEKALNQLEEQDHKLRREKNSLIERYESSMIALNTLLDKNKAKFAKLYSLSDELSSEPDGQEKE